MTPQTPLVALYVNFTYTTIAAEYSIMARKPTSAIRKRDPASREQRLGFRLDRQTKALIERAARLEGRTVTEYCVTALAETARRTIEQHETLVLSNTDRKVFFDALMNPPPANERLERAFEAARRRIRA